MISRMGKGLVVLIGLSMLAVMFTANTASAGEKKKGAIGDTVWMDADGDGILNNGEDGIGGVTVELIRNGAVYDTRVTNSDGLYYFNDLDGDDYTVRIVQATLPAGVAPTYDADGGLDHESSLALAEEEVNLLQDFGYRLLGNIGDTVWMDLDGDGVQNNGEVGIPGVDVMLRLGGVTIDVATTDANGMYLFESVPGGDYVVFISSGTLPKYLAQTYDASGSLDNRSFLALADGETNLDQDFGYQPLVGQIGDTVWFDNNGDGVQNNGEAGIPGVRVNLRQGGALVEFATTDANGMYLFDGLLRANYVVRITTSTLPADVIQTYDADGGLDARSVTFLDAGEVDLDQDFGYQQLSGAIGDTVWMDTDGDRVQNNGEAGIPGVTVLLRKGGVTVDSMITDAAGNYLFENLPSGNYIVRITASTLPSGLEQTHDASGSLDNRSFVTLAAGAIDLDQDFGYQPLLGAIGDTVWMDSNGDGVQNNGEAGIPGVRLNLRLSGVLIDTATTNANGEYLFENLVGGSYLVAIATVTLPAGVEQTYDAEGALDHRSHVNLDPGEIDLDQDFGYQLLGSIGDLVFFDRNSNAIYDPTGPVPDMPIEGATVTLFADGVFQSSQTTNSAGNYLFENLAVGPVFTVTVDRATIPLPQPVGAWRQTYDLDGTLDDSSQTTLPVVGEPDPLTDLRHDFGYTLDADSGGLLGNG